MSPPPQTAHQGRSLDTKLMLSMVWSAVSFGGGQLLTFGSMLVLARLLEPKAFGVVALAMTFLGLLQYLQESGLWAAIIYRRDDDLRAAASSALVFTPVVAIALYLPCALLAPFVADLFREPALTNVLRVIALLLIPRALGIVPTALLERELDYRRIAKVELSGALTQAVVCIGLAVAWPGVWALVLGYLAGASIQTTMLWIVAPWRPHPRHASWAVLREMMRYGRFVGAANILNLVNRTIDNMTVARVLGAAPLAFYAISYRLASMPVQVIGLIVGRGAFAAYASLQDDLSRLRQTYVEQVQRVAILALPTSVGIALTARPLVEALLGPRWLPTIVPLQILAVFGIVRGFSSTTGDVWLGLGKAHLRAVWEVLHAVLVVPALIGFTVWLGLKGAALGMLTVDVLTGVPAMVVTLRLLELRPLALLRALLPPLGCTGLMAATLLVLDRATHGLQPVGALALLLAAGAVAYCAASALFARSVLVPMWVSLRGARAASS